MLIASAVPDIPSKYRGQVLSFAFVVKLLEKSVTDLFYGKDTQGLPIK
jgi:hypothetical protein